VRDIAEEERRQRRDQEADPGDAEDLAEQRRGAGDGGPG